MDPKSRENSFDIVFDATGTPDGLEAACVMSRGEVHLKSTSGQEFHGLRNLTALVVDELSLLPFSVSNLSFHWESEDRENRRLYIAPKVPEEIVAERGQVFRGNFPEALQSLHSMKMKNQLPRFDLGMAFDIEEIDTIIRPDPADENSLVRPRGAILYTGDAPDNALLRFIKKGGILRSSRCGDFRKAVALLREARGLAELLADKLVTDKFDATRIPEAYDKAGMSDSMKVVIHHR
jgi:threonine dehydrogenase-like Zn-dependent dehydrogenase